MEQQPIDFSSHGRTRRSPVLALLGALTLGLILVFVCLALLTVPSRAEADLRHGMTLLAEINASDAGLDSSTAGGITCLPSGGAIASPDLTQPPLVTVDIVSLLDPAPVESDTGTPVQTSPSTDTTGDPTLVPGWFSGDNDHTLSIAWGDVDGDGDLDLAAGNGGYHGLSPNKVYLNVGGALQTQAAWVSNDYDTTFSIAWGDVDGDGDLDLATGNGRDKKVYLNEGGVLQTQATWVSSDGGAVSIAWGDVDGDGDLDLAAGNLAAPNKVYLNVGGVLQMQAAWASDDGYTYSIAWGDMDGDGDLDLAAGNAGANKVVYLNVGGVLQTQAAWVSDDSDVTYSIAWGDMDGDGDLDLAAGNRGTPNKVYLNEGGALQTQAAWASGDSDLTYSIAWGDVDGDGDLDLAAGNPSGPNANPNKVYLNVGGVLQTQAAWVSNDSDDTFSVAWGDVDGDGDLDLATGNSQYVYGAPNKVYFNEGSVLQSQAAWVSNESDDTHSIAWGDIDGDGDLDLAAGNSLGPNKMYLNVGGALQMQAAWVSNDSDDTFSIAWGDVDGDGDLDLAAGNHGTPNRVYLNEGGVLQTQAAWVSGDSDLTYSIAWGDVDGDGDLDLAAANDGEEKVYLNGGGMLQTEAAWVSNDNDTTFSIAWGDVDGDGDLDLAAANYGADKMYLNVGGVLQTQAAWVSGDSDLTYSIAWGDVDGDGDLDLATGNAGGNTYGAPNKVYLNESGMLQTQAAWVSNDNDWTLSIAWGDVDGDGDLDLAAGNRTLPYADRNKVYLNVGGVLQTQAAWVSSGSDGATSIAWGDVDGDGDLDLAAGSRDGPNKVYLGDRPAHPLGLGKPQAVELDLRSEPVSTFSQSSTALAPADFYAVPGIRGSGPIPITYRLFHPTSEPVRRVRAYFSPDGSLPNGRTNWRVAVPTADTDLTDLATSPYPTPTITSTHVYTWDVLGSGFFGQSDNVIVRVEALPNLRPLPNSVPGPFQRPYVSSQTFRFRVRGSQVRVMNDGAPAQGALVYRFPAGQTGAYEPYRDRSGHAYRTNGSGYLQGYGDIGLSDRLAALVPITATESYTLYYASASPTPSGIDPYTVSALGVQTLTVSSANPLVLFNLDVSLEWDARNDPVFLSQMEQDLHRASELLYDWSNGQAALGKVTIYHAKLHWQDAHVLIYANNRFRPAATEGGLISEVVSETVSIGATSVITYLPGQVAMGPVWNRYGDPGSNLGEDWPRAFAHEMAHYAFFLDDNYIGLDDNNLLMPVDTCPGVMADPYRDDAASGYGELHPAAGWLPACENTLSNRNTGRADWTTVGVFYPWLDTNESNSGPSVLPLAVTEVQVVEPITPTTTLQAPLFLLVQNGNRVIPDSRARSYLFQDGWAIDLGQPSQDRLLARGARPGDRLCVYDLGASRLGCETITSGDTELALVDQPGWQPEVTVTPVTSVTLAISVTNVPAGLSMQAKLYPLGEPSQGEMALFPVNGGYAGTFHLARPALVGVIQVWVDEPGQRREIVTDYVLGGNPARIWSGGARIWSGGARIWSGGARIWSGGAPVASADGQVVLYSPDHGYGPEWFLTVQASAVAPPPWATLVGKAYRVSASGNAPDLTTMSIAFSYLGSDVPPGEEPWLRVYTLDGTTWRQLTTRLDTTNNMASARVQGQGVYALMSSIEVSLYGPGWDLFGYPILETRPVTEALISISGFYTTVHGYDPAEPDPFARWRTYDVQMPGELDSLNALEFGEGYWIYVSQPITLFLKGAGQGMDAAPELQLSPATFFGTVTAGMGFTPTVGMPVTAWIDSRLCGRSQTQEVGQAIGYAIHVLSEGPGVAVGCGAAGRQVAFRVNSIAATPGAVWDNGHTRELTLQHCPDFNASGGVDVLDIALVANRWEQHRGQPGWSEQFDWDGDGDVDVVDIQQVAARWPRACS